MIAFKREMLAFKKEAERDCKRMNIQWGELANKMGTVGLQARRLLAANQNP